MCAPYMPDITQAITKAPDVRVVVQNDSLMFVAGDVIRGHLEVIIHEPTKIKDVCLRIYGSARVTYEGGSSVHFKGASTSTTRRQHTEVYIDSQISLLGKEKAPKRYSRTEDGDDGELHCVGKHTYPFHTSLPRHLPQSFTGRWGRICYSLKGIVERMWKSDVTHEVSIDLVGFSDLNSQPELLRPTGSVGCFRTGLLCFRSLPSNVELRVNRRGYVAGECVNFHAEVENNAGRSLFNVRVVLYQHVTFNFGDTNKKRAIPVATVRKGVIQPAQTLVWDDVMQVPVVPASGNPMATAIQIKYTLEICINHASLFDDYQLAVPVAIGTVPYRPSVVTGYHGIMSADPGMRGAKADRGSKVVDRGSKGSELSYRSHINELGSPTSGAQNQIVLNIAEEESEDENV